MRCICVTNYKEPLEARDYERPVPQGEEVLVRVSAAGVCHTDVHLWEGGYDLGEGRYLSLKERGATLPLVMGHETAGEVVAMGPDASGVEAGRPYLIYPWIGCGSCAVCKSGDEHLCANTRYIGVSAPGGYAEYVLVPKAKYLLDIEGIDPAVAAPYACSGVTTYSALKKAGAAVHEKPIVIIGAGGLGLMCLSILKAMGGIGAVVVDIDEQKRQAAVASGALAVVDGKAADVADRINAAIGEQPAVVIDFVGSPQTAALGFGLLAKGGKLIVVGLFGGAAPWSLPLFPMRGISVIGSLVGNLQDLTELLVLVREKKVPAIPITRMSLDDASDALEKLRKGELVGRAVLIP